MHFKKHIAKQDTFNTDHPFSNTGYTQCNGYDGLRQDHFDKPKQTKPILSVHLHLGRLPCAVPEHNCRPSLFPAGLRSHYT